MLNICYLKLFYKNLFMPASIKIKFEKKRRKGEREREREILNNLQQTNFPLNILVGENCSAT